MLRREGSSAALAIQGDVRRNGFHKVHPGEGLNGCEQKRFEKAEYWATCSSAMEYADVEVKDLIIGKYSNR
jgi:hypothetical protein